MTLLMKRPIMTHISTKTAIIALATLALTGCEYGENPDKTKDRGRYDEPLSDMNAGIWVDPNGCHHWIIDDGVEGYLSARLHPDGTPVCSGESVPNSVSPIYHENDQS